MKDKLAQVLLGGLVLATPMAAQAKEASFWIRCDGYNMAQNGRVNLGLGGLLTATKVPFQPGSQADGVTGVNACNEALNSPELDRLDWTRRTSLLKAKAIHNLEALRYTEALTDIEAARATALGKDASIFYARSTGVALDLLQSYTLLLLNKDSDAARYARQVAQARPYSAQIQGLGLFIMTYDPASADQTIKIAEHVNRLDPELGAIRLSILMTAKRYREAAELFTQEFGAKSDWVVQSDTLIDLDQLSRASIAAYVMARAGLQSEANAILTAARTRIAKAEKLKMRQFPARPLTMLDPDVTKAKTLISETLENWEPMITAASLFVAGDAMKAQDALIAKDSYPANDLFLGMIEDLRAAIPAEKRKALVAADPTALREKISGNRAERLKKITNNDLFNLLPQAEDEEKLNSFSSQAGFGLKSTGFKSKILPDGATLIEFVGTVSSPQAIAEMVLLRAAALAADAKKPAFIIEKNSNYTRFSQTTYNGTPTGEPRFAGYKSELTVRFVDDVATPRAIMNEEVVSALKPIYVRANSSKK